MVRPGYKQTDIGEFPGDWNVVDLPSVFWFQEGPGLRKWQFTKKGLKVINVTNLQESGFLDLDKTERHISWDEFEKMYKHFLIDENDFVMASSGNSYCKTSLVRACDLPLLMNTSVIRFKPKDGVADGYMRAYLISKYFKDQIDLLITGGAQPNFGPAHLKQILIPLPPKVGEQKSIAKALSDVDELIVSLEKLIAKKLDIKTATMQQLLTGKKRLPGFGEGKGYKQTELGEIPEDWDVKELDKISNVIDPHPSHRAPSEKSAGIPFLGIGDLDEQGNIIKEDYRVVSEDIYEEHKARYALEDNLLGLGRVASIGKVVRLRDDLGKYTVSPTLGIIHATNISSNYLYYILGSKFVDAQFKKIMSGSTRSSVGMNVLRKLLIPFPNNSNEVAELGEVLQAMDKNIYALQSELEKAKAIKQGMMQELLTGRTRLIDVQQSTRSKKQSHGT